MYAITDAIIKIFYSGKKKKICYLQKNGARFCGLCLGKESDII